MAYEWRCTDGVRIYTMRATGLSQAWVYALQEAKQWCEVMRLEYIEYSFVSKMI